MVKVIANKTGEEDFGDEDEYEGKFGQVKSLINTQGKKQAIQMENVLAAVRDLKADFRDQIKELKEDIDEIDKVINQGKNRKSKIDFGKLLQGSEKAQSFAPANLKASSFASPKKG